MERQLADEWNPWKTTPTAGSKKRLLVIYFPEHDTHRMPPQLVLNPDGVRGVGEALCSSLSVCGCLVGTAQGPGGLNWQK